MKIKEKVPLKKHTYYEIGGKARFFIEAKTKKEVKKALRFAKKKELSVFVLGEGTNVLIADDGFEGLVIKIKNDKLEVKNRSKKGSKLIEAGAGVKLREVVELALENNLEGLEWAAGIPGTVGGALRGNAGAFGASMADAVREARLIEPNEIKVKEFSREKLAFGYRSSIVKKQGGLVWEVVLGPFKRVADDKMKKIKEKADEHLEYRDKNQIYDRPSCGSVFKAVRVKKESLPGPLLELKKEDELLTYKLKEGRIKIPAGWLIEKAGLKGEKVGDAKISEKHANFIVNLGTAKARDVRELIELAQSQIKERFGVELECEVEMVGF